MSAKSKFKNIFKIALAGMFAMALTACTDEMIEYPEGLDGPVLRLSTGGDFTRGDEHYDDDESAEHKEEALNRVDLFFFASADSDQKAFYVYEVNIDKTTVADLTLRIPASYLDYFTPGSNAKEKKGYVYALVNLPASVVVDTENGKIKGLDATLENLEHTWVSEQGFATRRSVDNFVMHGTGEVSLTETTGWQCTGYVPLERLAAKVRLFAELPEKIYIDANGNTMQQEPGETDEAWQQRIETDAKEHWVPAPGENDSNMKLYFYNAATNGRIDGYVAVDKREDMGFMSVDRTTPANVIRDIIANPVINDVDKDSKYNYSHTFPYYSYPNQWNSKTPTEEYMTYVIIELPWRMTKSADASSSSEFRKCYYQVPVNAVKSGNIEADRLEPNKYYRIKIRLGALGSRDFGTPMDVSASYEVVDWVNANVDVNIKGKRYLVVNQKNWTVNNESYLEIPFSTSHKTVVDECYVTYFRYNDIWGYDDEGIPRNTRQGNLPANASAADMNTYRDFAHNKDEFKNWLDFADAQIKSDDPEKNGRNGEGFITMTKTTDGKVGDIMYYMKDYFYDPYYQKLEGNGFRYYVGHEHPITFNPDLVKYQDAVDNNNDVGNWQDFIDRYQMKKIYSCDIDDDRSVIMLNHPLVQWEPVRKNGQITHYKPLLSPAGRLWDEFSRVDIVIKIRHEDWTTDDGLYRETIYIRQYPGIYITLSHNYGEVNISSRPGANPDSYSYYSQKYDGNKYVRINGRGWQEFNEDKTNETVRMATFDLPDYKIINHFAGNTNPNMYLIHTTQLSEDYNNYVIGDPRALFINNYLSGLYCDDYIRNQNNGLSETRYATALDDDLPSGDAFHTIVTSRWSGRNWGDRNAAGRAGDSGYTRDLVSANVVYGGNRSLQFYYPTDESSLKENFIAPTFRIASSFGRTTVNGRAEMRRRCASYQEAGRPAGRWRVPTKAEIRYIAQLSADGKIPILFGSTIDRDAWGYYWSAQGGVQANAKGEVIDSDGDANYIDKGIMATRCVYDEWYWNQIDGGEFPEVIRQNGPLETTFYWGDRLKDNTQQIIRRKTNKR